MFSTPGMFQMLRARLNGMSSEGKAEYEKGLIKAFETLMKVSFLFVKNFSLICKQVNFKKFNSTFLLLQLYA